MTRSKISQQISKFAFTGFLFSLPLFLLVLFFGSQQVFANVETPTIVPATGPITSPCTPKPACFYMATGTSCRLPNPPPAGGWCN